jgi:hypothetical protein
LTLLLLLLSPPPPSPSLLLLLLLPPPLLLPPAAGAGAGAGAGVVAATATSYYWLLLLLLHHAILRPHIVMEKQARDASSACVVVDRYFIDAYRFPVVVLYPALYPHLWCSHGKISGRRFPCPFFSGGRRTTTFSNFCGFWLLCLKGPRMECTSSRRRI